MPVDASGSLPQEPEATTLAREIQHLVQSSPLPSATALDSRLAALLSNASFMNGSSLKTSIWSTLENIHRTPPSLSNSNPTSSPTHVGSETLPFKEGDDPGTAPSPNVYPNIQLPNDSFSDTSSIMVYSPLFPTQSDIVELAELVPYESDTDSGEVGERDAVEVNSSEGGDKVRTQEAPAGRASWTLKWPFSKWYRKDQNSQITVGSNNVVDSTNPPPTSQRIRTTRPRRAWVPSPSKISVQIFWWGYRLYLPPPILAILSDSTFEVSRRAAIITAALTWLFRELPIEYLPPPFNSIGLLKGLVPVLGIVGACISWGWNGIMSYDVGHGVTLSATWILPVALIPGTWHEADFPKSPTPNSPIPLPHPHFLPFSMESSFEPSTPAMSTTTDDDDTPTSAYATPMSSIISLYPAPDVDLFSASSSTAWSPGSPPPPPPSHLPISSPNSPNNLYFTPNSSTTTPIAHPFFQPLPPSTSSVPFTHNNNNNNNPSSTTPLPSPRIRTPRFSTRMGSPFSPLISSNSPHLITHNNDTIPASPPITITITPISKTSPSTSTPIPMPPTPIELPPIPPEFPLCPNLVNDLLRGPVLQNVPLPDVE